MRKFHRQYSTISGKLNDELVILDIQKGKYFSLNPVATRIWDFLEKPLTQDDLCFLLRKEYDVSEDQCEKEVSAHLEEMMKMGLIETLEMD